MIPIRRKRTAPAPVERRACQRVALVAEVTIDSEHNLYWGLSENVSEAGLFVSTFRPEPIGTEVDLSFTLPTHEGPLSVRARVQWVREPCLFHADLAPGMGLQFIDPSDEVLQAVRAFVRCREPAFYE
ncbi:MAG: PilZ domain-containing protein [Myxococcales bacterium]|nr:PilZ domain-containing protein [Myxococcales bacterium]